MPSSPDPGFAGVDRFRYRVNDGAADSGIGTVTIQISDSYYSVIDLGSNTSSDLGRGR